ncbi:MAG TPA: hypothetical protein ENH06_00765, partial [bacterium]|nr:hypothetical protein [bacterium]
MSFPEFKDFYEKNYELNKLECLIIWDGIREHVRDRDYSVVKSSFLLPSELDIIKKEVLSGIVKEKTIDIQDRIKEVMKDFENKTKKKKF